MKVSSSRVRDAYWLFLFVCIAWALAGCKTDQQKDAKRNITLRIVYDSDRLTEQWITGLSDAFLAGQPTLATGEAIRLDLVKEFAFDAGRRIASGELKTAGWLAPYPALADFANKRRVNLGPAQTDCVSIVRSPIIVASQVGNQKIAGLEDYPHEVASLHAKQFSWSELRRYLEGADPSYFSLAQPQKSSRGFLAQYLALGVLTAEQDGSMIGSLEARIQSYKARMGRLDWYAPSENLLLEQLADDTNRSRNSFIFVSERTFLSRSDLHPKLVALYPKEGTAWEDQSMCVSAADWVTSAHQVALKKFIEFARAETSQKNAQAAFFHSSDSGPPEAAARLGQLVVKGDELSSLFDRWDLLRKPLALVISLDTSASVGANTLSRARDFLRPLIVGTDQKDLFSLSTFHSSAQIVAPLSRDKQKALAVLDVLEAVGGSTLFDGMALSLQPFESVDPSSHRSALLVITDGDDKNSDKDFNSLVSDLRRYRDERGLRTILIYVNTEGTVETPLRLQELMKASGGTLLATLPDGLDQLLVEVRSVF